MYPFMNLCRLYQKAAGVEPGFLVTGITDEYLSAINARDIWLNKPLQAQAIYEENCSNSSNPIILYWMHELYKSINKDDLAFEYLEKAKKEWCSNWRINTYEEVYNRFMHNSIVARQLRNI